MVKIVSRVPNRKIIRQLAYRQCRANHGKTAVAIAAIILTAALMSSLFTVAGSLLVKMQEDTMRQVGGKSHVGYKYLTQAEYDTLAADSKIKSITYRIIVGDVANKELIKLPAEVNYFDDADAKDTFTWPETGRMPQDMYEIATSDLVLQKLGVPAEPGQKVNLDIRIGELIAIAYHVGATGS